MSREFKVGDKVRWVKPVDDEYHPHLVGTVTKIYPKPDRYGYFCAVRWPETSHKDIIATFSVWCMTLGSIVHFEPEVDEEYEKLLI